MDKTQSGHIKKELDANCNTDDSQSPKAIPVAIPIAYPVNYQPESLPVAHPITNPTEQPISNWSEKHEAPTQKELIAEIRGQQWAVLAKSSLFYSNPKFTSMLWAKEASQVFEDVRQTFTTIEQTAGWRWLSKRLMDLPPDRADALLRPAMLEASRCYAKAASGDVVALVFEATQRSFFEWNKGRDLTEKESRNSTDIETPRINNDALEGFQLTPGLWHAELPVLLFNPNVRTINNIPVEALQKKLVDSPIPALALAKISRELGIASTGLRGFKEVYEELKTKQNLTDPKILPVPIHPSDGRKTPFNEEETDPWKHTTEPINKSAFPLSDYSKLMMGDRKLTKGLSRLRDVYDVSAILIEDCSITKDTCRNYGTVPGGMLLSSRGNFDFNLESINFDRVHEGILVINDELEFETGLTPEETAIIYQSVIVSQAGMYNFGATNFVDIVGTANSNIVGMALSFADCRLGEIIWGFGGKGQFTSIKHPEYQNPTLLTLDNCVDGDIDTLHSICLNQYDPVVFSMFLEIPEIMFAASDEGELDVVSLYIEVHPVVYKGPRDNPNILGGIEEMETRKPEYAESLQHFSDNIHYYFEQEHLFDRYIRYAACIALFREIVATNANIQGEEYLYDSYRQRINFNIKNDYYKSLGKQTKRLVAEDINSLLDLAWSNQDDLEGSLQYAICAIHWSQHAHRPDLTEEAWSMIDSLLENHEDLSDVSEPILDFCLNGPDIYPHVVLAFPDDFYDRLNTFEKMNDRGSLRDVDLRQLSKDLDKWISLNNQIPIEICRRVGMLSLDHLINGYDVGIHWISIWLTYAGSSAIEYYYPMDYIAQRNNKRAYVAAWIRSLSYAIRRRRETEERSGRSNLVDPVYQKLYSLLEEIDWAPNDFVRQLSEQYLGYGAANRNSVDSLLNIFNLASHIYFDMWVEDDESEAWEIKKLFSKAGKELKQRHRLYKENKPR